MSELKELIDGITEFGVNPEVELEDKTEILKKLLVGLYSKFMNMKYEYDQTDYDDEPNFDYKGILINVKSNFPDFGWYNTILNINKVEPNVEIGIGDALDDLTDIIKDLLAVKWRMENTSETDALWHFDFLMRNHSEQHLLDLLKYLKEKES